MEDQALGRSAAAVSHVQRRELQLGVDTLGECVTYDLPNAQIFTIGGDCADHAKKLRELEQLQIRVSDELVALSVH